MGVRIYRPAPWLAWFGLFFAGVYGGILCVSVVFLSLTDPTPRGPLFDILFVVLATGVWGTMTGLSLYVLAAGVAGKVIAEGVRLTFIGPLRKQTINLREVSRVRWRNNDSVKLYAGRRRQSIWFGSARLEDAADLVKLIRQNVPGTLQEGWHPFFAARMQGRYDTELCFRMIHPRAKRMPAPVSYLRVIKIAFATGLTGGAFGGALLEFQLRALGVAPPRIFSPSPLLDWLIIGLVAPLPLVLLFGAAYWLERHQKNRLARDGNQPAG